MKDIQGYEGLYAITRDGKIWSYRRERFMSTRVHHSTGYQMINLCKDGERKTYLVHRLVAQAYIPNPENLPVVHHKNSIRTDCRVENLEFVSQEKNMIYRAIYEKVDYLRSLGFTVEIPQDFKI
jgi:hypothetical protein